MASKTATTSKTGRKYKGAKPQTPAPSKFDTFRNIFDSSRGETIRILSGLALLFISLFLILACISFVFTGKQDQIYIEQGFIGETEWANWASGIGAYASYYIINHGFGLAVFFPLSFLLVAALRALGVEHIRLWKWFLNCSILMIWTSMAMDYWVKPILEFTHTLDFLKPGGTHGIGAVNYLRQYVGSPGVFIVLLFSAVCYMAYVSGETIRYIKSMLNPLNKLMDKKNGVNTDDYNQEEGSYYQESEDSQEGSDSEDVTVTLDLPTNKEEQTGQTDSDDKNEQETAAATAGGDKDLELIIEDPHKENKASGNTVEDGDAHNLQPYDPKKDLENYRYPKLDLLDKHGNANISVDLNEQNANKDRIIKVLKDFGVEISTIKATIGPTITLYEIQPAPGVKISKIRNLEDDIALSLAALGIRIIAPIPGKGTIGIEVPNAKPQIVSMESILNSKRFQETDYELPCAVGKTISNEVYMFDLAKMPHLLVAGATGQGKSVGLNAIITSLLYKKHPAELKFVMVDPKKVEFSVYSPLVKHFLAQVEDEPEDDAIITDVKKVVAVLNSLCAEMDARYDLLKQARVRNIKEYNARFKERKLNPQNGHRFMPYIVVIIDEFGDLIMTAGKEVELPIARIAQLARAVGIHMIIATQRPTTNIITGTIKANFPARMAFKVSAMIDSRTILDRPGANQLVGRGDMLFLSGSEPVRVQCAFVDTPEVERIAAHIARQQGYTTSMQLPRVTVDGDDSEVKDVDMTHLDPMFADAARLIVTTQSGSTSMIQRKLSLGFNRAGRLMDQLETAGVVGPAQGSKPREVLIHDELSLENLLNSLR